MTERLVRGHEIPDDLEITYTSSAFEMHPDLYLPEVKQGVYYIASSGRIKYGLLNSQFTIVSRLDPNSGDYQETLRSVKICDVIIWELFRRRGIGTNFLKYAEEDARTFRANTIWGLLVPLDLVERPWLPQFYSKNGYEVEDKNGYYEVRKTLSSI